MSKVKIYTDGSANNNVKNGNRRGGWAAVFVSKNDKKLWHMAGGNANTTNNRMEMMAVLEALKYADTLFDHITVYSDSQYLVNGITKWIYGWLKNNWKNGRVKNKDLWEQLLDFVNRDDIEFRWVKGHSKNRWNRHADRIARRAR